MDDPPIRLFVTGSNTCRFEHEWPLARARATRYYLRGQRSAKTPRGDGELSLESPNDEPADQYVYDPRDPVMSVYLPSAQFGPGDLRALDNRQDILVYQTKPLAQAVEVTGPVSVTLYAASSARDTDWTARLADVAPDGLAVNLCEGIVRARFRQSWEQPMLLEPGRLWSTRSSSSQHPVSSRSGIGSALTSPQAISPAMTGTTTPGETTGKAPSS